MGPSEESGGWARARARWPSAPWAASCAIACATAWPGSARSEPAPPEPDVALEWSAPPGCSTGADVRAKVLGLLGPRAHTKGRSARARGEVSALARGGFGLRLSVTTEDGTVQRTLEAKSCRALADAAALVIALGYDPVAVVLPEPSEPLPAPPAPAAAPSPVAAPPLLALDAPATAAALRARPRRAGLAVTLGLGGVLDVGSLPGLSAGFTGSLAVGLRPLRLELRGSFFPEAEAGLTVTGTRIGGLFQLATGALSLCREVLPWTPLRGVGVRDAELSACLGVEGGVLGARSFGIDDVRAVEVPWIAPTLLASGRTTFARPFGARLDVGLAVPLDPYVFEVGGVGRIHAVSALSARAQLSIEARFE